MGQVHSDSRASDHEHERVSTSTSKVRQRQTSNLTVLCLAILYSISSSSTIFASTITASGYHTHLGSIRLTTTHQIDMSPITSAVHGHQSTPRSEDKKGDVRKRQREVVRDMHETVRFRQGNLSAQRCIRCNEVKVVSILG